MSQYESRIREQKERIEELEHELDTLDGMYISDYPIKDGFQLNFDKILKKNTQRFSYSTVPYEDEMFGYWADVYDGDKKIATMHPDEAVDIVSMLNLKNDSMDLVKHEFNVYKQRVQKYFNEWAVDMPYPMIERAKDELGISFYEGDCLVDAKGNRTPLRIRGVQND